MGQSMTNKQRAFIAAYTNCDNKTTYLNATQSYLSAYDANYGTASTEGRRSLLKPAIQNEIKTILEGMGIGTLVRIGKIKDIIEGKHKTKSETLQYSIDKDTGEERLSSKQISISEPKASTILKAEELLFKIDGTLDKVRVEADIAKDVYKKMKKNLLKSIVGNLK
jgi:phage terminase small subunit